MNIHNKLKKLGFKKCDFYRIDYDSKLGDRMVVDNHIIRKDWKGKIISIENVYHSKSDSMYKLIVNCNFVIWADIKSNSLSKLIFEDKSNKNFKEVSISFIESKSDILDLLPKEIKRDIILSELFS